jgi:hypothetical protein
MPERPQLVVVDSTPIISLALIDKLDLLQRLYNQVVIPPAVQNEVLAGRPGTSGRAEQEEQLGSASSSYKIPSAQRCSPIWTAARLR